MVAAQPTPMRPGKEDPQDNLLLSSPGFTLRCSDSSGAVTEPSSNGVIVYLDRAKKLRPLAHEFVHVAQYDRLGSEGSLP